MMHHMVTAKLALIMFVYLFPTLLVVQVKVLKLRQGRYGPGRIHHCMRCIGAAEKSLELMIDRGMSRTAFGKEILKLGGNLRACG